MSNKGWFVAALVAGGLVYGLRGGCLNSTHGSPDQKLAHELEEVCDIGRANVRTPERGVRRLGQYLGDHNLIGDFGNIITLIEKIDDDEAHDERAHLARERIREPLRACARDWIEFMQAVERDPAASALVNRAAERLDRTLEIIFSKRQSVDLSHDLLQLPAQLDQLLAN